MVINVCYKTTKLIIIVKYRDDMNGSPPRPEQKSNSTKFNRALRDELKPIVIVKEEKEKVLVVERQQKLITSGTK